MGVQLARVPTVRDGPVRLAAVGDILLAAGPPGVVSQGTALLSEEVRALFGSCDIVFGNLECAIAGDGVMVPTEPRVIAAPEMIRKALAPSFNIVTLANNHVFDGLADGFHRTRALLDELGVAYFGAGDDLAEAVRPALMRVRGARLAFLGAVDERSRPAQCAGIGQWGVAPLDVGRLTHDIRRLRGEVDHVIVSLHWGEERFLIPSPAQVEQARALADAGASLILGHHPHVIQGLETYRGATIIYSLGNFVACDIPCSDGDWLRWSRRERTGCILRVDLLPGHEPKIMQVPIYHDGRCVQICDSGFSKRRLAHANRALSRGITPARYRRECFRVRTILPILSHLRWSKLKRLRMENMRRFAAGVARDVRG